MVRLNGRIALRRNSDENEDNTGTRFFPMKVNFFGLLGLTMMALKLKEHWEGYRKVPTEPPATGTTLVPPPYRDDECDAESTIGLDTSFNVPVRPRRKKTCCVCCGMNCSLFCKALGIAVLVITVWNAFKLAKWILTPSPTGLENMPEFNTSLGCLDVAHFYQNNKEGIFYTIPVGSNVDHVLTVDGGAVGTIVLAPSTNIHDDTIKVRASLRSSDARLLNSIKIRTPNSDPLPPSDTPSSSYFSLSTPTQAEGVDTCIRYDLIVYIPPTLRTLHVTSRSVAQVKTDFENTPRELGRLSIDLESEAAANLVLPSLGLVADNVEITMRGGYLVGTLPIANATSIDTTKGDAITIVDVSTTGYDIPEANGGRNTAYLYSYTGIGRTDVTYTNIAGRPIRSEHSVRRGRSDSELRLTYKDAGFNGRLDVDAHSYSMRNVQSDGFGSRPGDSKSREFWVGDKDGSDYLKIASPGWVGIYF